ncbi:NUDIX hydrolase [Phaeobacter sp. B1627]|uniref:NUDIX hydrolase n=1 Tax=Phaeobacter sp. B1627 TaxID=2583809 RepID=UPI0011196595|nr:NUDIX hydrolase [Phaeobacter sp. B1627]TNJ41831.1 NUDIX hydrolase [Phaeobacter sp. B1627]
MTGTTGPEQSRDKTAIRDAATVIAVRDRDSCDPRVLMGQRGAQAAFMPNKFVFPGGAMDAGDLDIALHADIAQPCRDRLRAEGGDRIWQALCIAAVRELWEETGLILGRPGHWPGTVPADWQSYAAAGHVPDASALTFVFRALTPPGRPRRFDARFFLLEAESLVGDLDDFSRASDELSHLQWVPLSQVRRFDLPFITEVVLAEVSATLRSGKSPESTPFFRNDDEESLFLRLHGRPMPQAD